MSQVTRDEVLCKSSRNLSSFRLHQSPQSVVYLINIPGRSAVEILSGRKAADSNFEKMSLMNAKRETCKKIEKKDGKKRERDRKDNALGQTKNK